MVDIEPHAPHTTGPPHGAPIVGVGGSPPVDDGDVKDLVVRMSMLRKGDYMAEKLLQAKAIAATGAAVGLVVHMDHLGDAYSGLPFVFRGFRTLEDTKAALRKLREA